MECLICGSSKPKLITSSRVSSLRSASHERGDGLSDRLEEGSSTFMCHINCVSTYCSKTHIARAIKKKTSDDSECESNAKRLRGSNVFSFREHCLFCGEICDIERPSKNPGRWREAYLCRTADRRGRHTFKEAILLRAESRGDVWAHDVSFRVNSSVSDLHAADARYHKNCMSKFFSNPPSSRETAVDCDQALDALVKKMQSNRSHMWNSIDLHKMYCELQGIRLSRRTLIDHLQEKLAPELIVLSSPGVASIIAFRSHLSSQTHLVNDTEDNIERAIKDVSKRIQSESHAQDPRIYPTRVTLDQALG